MCGIAGFINFEGHKKDEARELIRRMTDVLLHRGPDEEGYYVDDYAALGHRRLSIIDLAGGQQPIGTKDGKVQIIFNGEIYNFLELRSELESKGYQFRTNSDTEVILIAYIEWQQRCVEKLNGMFAFAIWDAENRTLFLARDRVGKKPLYYYSNGKTIAFASELKSLRAGSVFPFEIDPESLDCYFSFGYIPAPRTIYRNVKKLNAAHYLKTSARFTKESRYWHLSFAQTTDRSLEDAADKFLRLLDEAVKCRLMSEVPLGVFLSGGLDSPLVVSSMAKLMANPVLTNTIGFEDEEFNEVPVAKALADHFKTNHKEFFVRPNAMEVLEKIAWHFDEPFADPSALPTWYVSKMARENVTVALSGDGGDESFGGYTFRYIPHIVESKIRSKLPLMFRSLVFGALGSFYPAYTRLPRLLKLKTIFENLAVDDAEAFYKDLTWLRQKERDKIYHAGFMSLLKGFNPFELVYPLYHGCNSTNPLFRSQFTDIQFYMTDDVLVKVDRMSMAHSLEVRSPLLDYRLIEFAATLPEHLKLNKRYGKLVLQKAADKRLPADIIRRQKKGFSIPAANWLRNDLKNLANDVIFRKSSIIADYLKLDEIQRIWNEHQSESRDNSMFLWGLMMLGLWEKKHS